MHNPNIKKLNRDAKIGTSVVPDLSCCDPGLLFPNLRFGTYRFTYKVPGQNNLSGYLGSAWRGVLGPALQKEVCPWFENPQCSSCRIADSCIYYFLYEQKSNVPGYTTPPRPYIISPVSMDNGLLQVDMRLTGMNHLHTIQIIKSWQNISVIGVGNKKTDIQCTDAEQQNPSGGWQGIIDEKGELSIESTSHLLGEYLDTCSPPPAPPWLVRKATPLRLRRKGKYLHHSDWSFAFNNLVRTVSLLAIRAGGECLVARCSDELKNFMNNPGQIQDSEYWKDLKRFSSRQNKTIPLGGLQGSSLVIPPPGLELLWWQWWKVAEIFHLGKGTVMGLGKITISRQPQ